MKYGALFAAVAAVVLIAFGVYMIDIDQTEEAALPDVDVLVEGANVPEFEAEMGEVELTEETTTVEVPEVEVTTEEAELTVPGIEVTPPEEETDSETTAAN